jgi:hypothetical protein
MSSRSEFAVKLPKKRIDELVSSDKDEFKRRTP